jgi:hypothetical protein
LLALAERAVAAMSRRALLAAAILALWLGGIAALTRREMFGGESRRLERAAMFVSPGTEFYALTDGDRHIGFASSAIDTTTNALLITDLVTADLPAASGAGTERMSARSTLELTRTLRLVRFSYEVRGEVTPYRVTGSVRRDTVLRLSITSGKEPPREKLVPLRGPVVLPSMLPMVIALGERPKVGRTYSSDVFDPTSDSLTHVTVRIRAESLFVVADSATYDADARRWVAANSDTVRAWRIEQDGGGPLTGWIDSRGRMVEGTALGRLAMRRTAYEMAFENWKNRSNGRDSTASIARPQPPRGAPPSN